MKYKVNLSYHFFDQFGPNHSFLLLSPVKDELELLIKRGRKFAKLALSIAESHTQEVMIDEEMHQEKEVDDIILEYALQHNAIIATNDKQLRLRAKVLGIPLISIKGKAILSYGF